MITTSVMKELKWGKNEEKCWLQHILWSSKILFCFWIEPYIFFQMIIFATLFRRCLTLKMITLFRCCLTLFSSTLKNTTLFYVVNFNIDVTLCDVATLYQPENNVEPTFKCLLGACRSLIFIRVQELQIVLTAT